MKPFAILLGLALLATAACDRPGAAQSQTAALDQFSDPSPYANPVEAMTEPSDGAKNEIGD